MTSSQESSTISQETSLAEKRLLRVAKYCFGIATIGLAVKMAVEPSIEVAYAGAHTALGTLGTHALGR